MDSVSFERWLAGNGKGRGDGFAKGDGGGIYRLGFGIGAGYGCGSGAGYGSDPDWIQNVDDKRMPCGHGAGDQCGHGGGFFDGSGYGNGLGGPHQSNHYYDDLAAGIYTHYTDACGAGCGNNAFQGSGEGHWSGCGDWHGGGEGGKKPAEGDAILILLGDGTGTYIHAPGLLKYKGQKVYYVDGVPCLPRHLQNEIAFVDVIFNDMRTKPMVIVKRDGIFAFGTTAKDAFRALDFYKSMKRYSFEIG